MRAQDRIGLYAALRQLFAFMSMRRRLHFAAALMLMLLGALAETAAIASLLGFLSLLAGDASASNPFARLLTGLVASDPAAHVHAAAYLFMAIAVGAGAIRLLLAWTTQGFVHRLGHDVSLEIMRRILFQPYRFHTMHHSSELLSSLDKTQVLVHVLLQLMQAAAAAVIASFIVAILIWIDPFTAATAAAVFAGFYLLVSRFAAARLASNSAVSSKAYAERLKMLHESLGGIRDVIIDQSQKVFLDAFRTIDQRFARAVASTDIIAVAPRLLVETIGMVAVAGMTLTLASREGGLSSAIPILAATALGGLRLLPFAQQLYASWATLSGNRETFGEVLALLRLPVADRSEDVPDPLPFRESIRFEQVCFSYPGQPRPALGDASFAIPHGSKVAIGGSSGSGKSTLADLLMGLLEPDSGAILVDGVALTTELRRRWRRNIAHVPQSIFLADASVLQNIAMGVPDARIDQHRVAEAVRIAQLDKVIAELPDGIRTRIGEGGVRLSGGQRQRIGIARAAYKDAPLLVLDEATSALDAETETAILEALTTLANRTILIITHHPSAIARCDRLVFVERGRPVECTLIGAS